MVTLFALLPKTIPEFALLEKAVLPAYTMMPVETLDDLAQNPDQKGVVLVGYAPDRTATWLAGIKSVAPRMSTLMVVSRDRLPEVTADMTPVADMLVVPTLSVEVEARLSAAFQLSELRYLIHESAQLDDTTGLYSLNYFMRRIGEEISLAKRHQSPVSCAILSISYYDVYLDSYGFQFANNLVQHVAQVVKSHVRNEDLVARVSNSEIGLLLPRSTEKGAFALIRRIQERVEESPMYLGDQVEHLFLKAGIAGFPTRDESDMEPDTLIRYTRHALHFARCSEEVQTQLFSDMKPFVGS